MAHLKVLQPIPPLSVVQLISDDPGWSDQKGRIFRIGYYSRQDGLDCVWLVDDTGLYEQTTDQESTSKDFAILQTSSESDVYGVDREVLGRRSPLPELTGTEHKVPRIKSANKP